MSKWPNSIILIRHGQSAYNLAKDEAKKSPTLAMNYRTAGRDQDTPLTPLGVEQANIAGQYLKGCVGEFWLPTVFTSPYLRARQTTDAIRSNLPQTRLVVEERIREIEFGCLDGLTPHGRKVYYPEEAERLEREGKYWYRPPGGESRPDVALRVHSFLDTLVRDYSGHKVIIVCHSVVVLTFRRLFERWGEDQYLQVDRENEVHNCALTEYAPDDAGRIQLMYYNKYPHDLHPQVFGAAHV